MCAFIPIVRRASERGTMRQCIRSIGAAWLLVIVSGCAVSGCASNEPIKIKLEQSPTAFATHYTTYAWRSLPAERTNQSPSAGTRRDWFIRATVDRLLAAKGYTRSADDPGFLVDYEIVEKQKQTSSVQDFYNYRRAGGSEDLIDAFTIGYVEGTLMLGIFDGSTRQLIWRASATLLADQKNSNALIAEALRRMLARWPNQ
jgi:hypothetical protein